jgi:hypothetical protein
MGSRPSLGLLWRSTFLVYSIGRNLSTWKIMSMVSSLINVNTLHLKLNGLIKHNASRAPPDLHCKIRPPVPRVHLAHARKE